MEEKSQYLRNELGGKRGKAFYTYPHPEYTRPEFLVRPF
jgi:hypothetical protein